jgi:hypothetical protein
MNLFSYPERVRAMRASSEAVTAGGTAGSFGTEGIGTCIADTVKDMTNQLQEHGTDNGITSS